VFDISPEKLAVVFVVALVLLGPGRIPEVARALARARSELRQLTSSLQPDTLKVIRDPRRALIDAIAEPSQIVSEATAQSRMALDEAVRQFDRQDGIRTPDSQGHEK
jgi:Sec-independent protein translocase protein TatA